MPPSRPTRRRALALVAAAALALAACGGDDDISRETFEEDLQERTGIPESVAACITDGVFEEFDDQEDINEIYRAADDEELGDRTEVLADINQRCWEAEEADDADADADEGSDTTTTTAGDGEPSDADATTTTAG